MPKTTELLVMDVMKQATIVPRDIPISRALDMMRRGGDDFLTVVDENHKLTGALSENNLIRLLRHQPPLARGDAVWYDSLGPEAGAQPVESIMTTNIVTIRANETLATALKVMNSASYRLLHVVDRENLLLGVVRMRDIVARLLRPAQER
jgi:CBS domain-containing protein